MTTLGRDQGSGLLGGLEVDVGANDTGAFTCKNQRGLATDAANKKRREKKGQ